MTLSATLASYRRPNLGRGLFEIAITLIPLAGLWALAWLAIRHHIWWGLLLTVPAAGFLVRLFMIQHDCGHGAFFGAKAANDWVGRALGVLTMTPYDYWRSTHAIHHATSGDLDRRTLGGVETLTVAEYLALSPMRRLGYRLYRHPLVMFGLGPGYMFILQHRLPIGLMRGGWRPWVSTMATNLAIAGGIVGMALLTGLWPFVLVHLSIVMLAATIGVWLFYVQHQFEHAYWTRSSGWSLREAAMQGSSHYDLHPVLRWFSANIGLHHLHHLSSRIPFYRLGRMQREHPELQAPNRLTLIGSLRCVGLSLWDEASGRLVSFRQMRRAQAKGGGIAAAPN